MRQRCLLAVLPLALTGACGSSESAPPTQQPSNDTGGSASGGSGSTQPPGPSGGSGGDTTTTQPAEPIEARYEGNLVRLSVGSLVMRVDPLRGGRVVGFRREGHDVLLSSAVDDALFGSTFWTSPQSDWDWPPVSEIDEAPYEVLLEGNVALLIGPESPSLGVHVEKRFEPLARERAIRVTYSIVNDSDEAVSHAPWEVTRVPAGGLTFFPAGTLILEKSNLDTASQKGHIWYASPASPLGADDQKLHADGRHGWLAHVHDGALFVKTFEDIAPEDFAPGHGEVEIFANQGGTYVEIEQQGIYRTIDVGADFQWSVEWRLERLPATLEIESGSDQLLSAVADVIDGSLGDSAASR